MAARGVTQKQTADIVHNLNNVDWSDSSDEEAASCGDLEDWLHSEWQGVVRDFFLLHDTSTLWLSTYVK